MGKGVAAGRVDGVVGEFCHRDDLRHVGSCSRYASGRVKMNTCAREPIQARVFLIL